MRIYEDDNGCYVLALSRMDEEKPEHQYEIVAGSYQATLFFQCGPVKEAGVNGPQCEALIAILIHRLKVLNTTFPSRETALAITKLEEALHWLDHRTADRQARGVEGRERP